MSPTPNSRDVTAGITNTRLSAVKRGVAVEVALRLARVTQHEVCLVGADPTDRDVQRRLPGLLAHGQYRRMGVRQGPYAIDFVRLPDRRLNIVTFSDRAVVESMLTRLQQEFRFVIIDAPSRVGSGVGIARVLLQYLDALVVASRMRAGELAVTQAYLDGLKSVPSARHVDVRVLLEGSPTEGGLAPHQLERKLGRFPLLRDQSTAGDDVDTLVNWIIELGEARAAVSRSVSGRR